jgi:hypothetical protein
MPISIATIEGWMRDQTGKHAEWGIDWTDWEEDAEEGGPHWLMHFLGSCTPKFREFMQSQGLHWDGVWINFDVGRFPIIRAIADRVREDYEKDPMVRDLWNCLELSGDDDVDYNGGYITTALDILETYARVK